MKVWLGPGFSVKRRTSPPCSSIRFSHVNADEKMLVITVDFGAQCLIFTPHPPSQMERSAPSPQTGSPIKRGSCFCASQRRRVADDTSGSHTPVGKTQLDLKNLTHRRFCLRGDILAVSAGLLDLWPEPGGQDTTVASSGSLRWGAGSPYPLTKTCDPALRRMADTNYKVDGSDLR